MKVVMALGKLGLLDLLDQLYGRVLIPSAVHTEVGEDPFLSGP